MDRMFNAMKDPQGYLEPEQIKRIIDSCFDFRNKVLLMVLARSGRRISEILMLKPKDINYADRTIVWNILKKPKDVKGRAPRKIKPIDRNTLDSLRKYVEVREIPPERKVFEISRIRAYQIVRDACEMVGITQIGDTKPHPHHFRHSFSVNFVRKYGDNTETLRVLQQYLEHSDIGVTAGYLQFSQEHIRAVMEKMWE